MSRVVSVHEYTLAAGVDSAAFERAVAEAERRGLFDLPGLVEYRFLEGLRGDHRDSYAALWIYESREAWEELWGAPGAPIEADEYPERWLTWENELLAPLLDCDPDDIAFTSYEEL
ncbi:hypothetical protein [Halococcus saccharolyticus]|nr:hypothetical protein [Halococcus saccharolyticus]